MEYIGKEKEVYDILKQTEAFLEGHFLLSSGLHSAGYCQCAKLLRYPQLAERVLKTVAEQVRNVAVDVVCGPAMGGVIVSYELGRQLGKESIFTERVDGVMQLRRGFTVEKGAKVLITEDVVTTGKSTMETVKALTDMGADVVGVCCIADRRGDGCVLELPVYSAIRLYIATYAAEDCPLCKEGKPLVKPGSRKELSVGNR
ncbi:MAG: orotate phosphoribosyltransferase [Clostridia bacterium]|nr:orotate phosphoribosyltransferase [Clostridia bacterium]